MSRRRFDDLPAATQAGILCNQGDFQRFCADRQNMPPDFASESTAAETVRRYCGIASRAELGNDPTARAKFSILRLQFDQWRRTMGKEVGSQGGSTHQLTAD